MSLCKQFEQCKQCKQCKLRKQFIERCYLYLWWYFYCYNKLLSAIGFRLIGDFVSYFSASLMFFFILCIFVSCNILFLTSLCLLCSFWFYISLYCATFCEASVLVIVWATFCDASVLLIVWALSVTRASPLLKGSYAVVNPPIKYITRDHQYDMMMMMMMMMTIYILWWSVCLSRKIITSSWESPVTTCYHR